MTDHEDRENRKDVVDEGGEIRRGEQFPGEILYFSAHIKNLKERLFWQNSTHKRRKDRNPVWKFCAQRSLEIMGLIGRNFSFFPNNDEQHLLHGASYGRLARRLPS